METNCRGTVRHVRSSAARIRRANKFRNIRSLARRTVKQLKKSLPKLTSIERKAQKIEACLLAKSHYRNGNHSEINSAANPAPRVQNSTNPNFPREDGKRIRVQFDEGTHDGQHPAAKTFQSELFTDLLNDRSLVSPISNRKGKMRREPLTFQHLTNFERVLYDHILISSKWKNSVRRVCALPKPFPSHSNRICSSFCTYST